MEKLFLSSLFSRNFYQIFILFLRIQIWYILSKFYEFIFINFHDPLSTDNKIDLSLFH